MKARLGDYIREYSVRNKDNEDIPVYSVTNSQGFCRGYFDKEVASKDKTTYKIVPKRCFAYNPSRINVGSVDWLRNEDRVIVSPLYNVFSVAPELDQQYLYYYLKSDITLYFIKALATGSVRDNLKLQMLYEFPINLPALGKQKQIAQILDKLNKVIAFRQKQIQVLDNLVKARFVEMFGDPIPNNKALPWRKLSEISKLKSGKAIKTGELSEDKRSNTPYPCYGGNGIRGFINRYSHEGDFPIIGRQGAWAGNVNYATGQFYATEHAVVATPIINLNTIWYYHSLKLLNLYRFQTGAAQPGLAVEKLNEVLIPFPEVSYQNQFATFVSQVDKSKFV